MGWEGAVMTWLGIFLVHAVLIFAIWFATRAR